MDSVKKASTSSDLAQFISSTKSRMKECNMIPPLLREKPPMPIQRMSGPTGFQGIVSWVNNLDDFYVVPCCSKDSPDGDPSTWNDCTVSQPLLNLEKKLQFEEKEKFTKRPLSGELVAVNIGAPGAEADTATEAYWKRGVVLRVENFGVDVKASEENVKVQLIDSGEIRSVSLESITKLPSSVSDIPPMAYRCAFKSLHGKRIEDTDELGRFAKFLVHKVVTVDWLPEKMPLKIEYGKSIYASGFAEKNPFSVELEISRYLSNGTKESGMISEIVAKKLDWKQLDPIGKTDESGEPVYLEVSKDPKKFSKRHIVAKVAWSVRFGQATKMEANKEN